MYYLDTLFYYLFDIKCVYADLCKTIKFLIRINMKVRRLGGAYGAKLSRSSHAATVCALASHLLQRPVRIVLNLETNMAWQGKRFPCYTEYEVRTNKRYVIE